jgi:hypothetical protein
MTIVRRAPATNTRQTSAPRGPTTHPTHPDPITSQLAIGPHRSPPLHLTDPHPDPALSTHARHPRRPLISCSFSNPPPRLLAPSSLARLDLLTTVAAQPPDGCGGPMARAPGHRGHELLATPAEEATAAPSSWLRQRRRRARDPEAARCASFFFSFFPDGRPHRLADRCLSYFPRHGPTRHHWI